VNKLLRMLHAELSLSLAARLEQNGLLAAKKAERVNSSLELQDLSVDKKPEIILVLFLISQKEWENVTPLPNANAINV